MIELYKNRKNLKKPAFFATLSNFGSISLITVKLLTGAVAKIDAANNVLNNFDFSVFIIQKPNL